MDLPFLRGFLPPLPRESFRLSYCANPATARILSPQLLREPRYRANPFAWGKRLQQDNTGTAEYTYDANGNLTKDQNKGILSITYNYLNLPVSITKTGGTRVEYSYDAAGTKRQQRYYLNGTLTKTTDFYTNIVYENSVPAWVTYDEGRVVLNSNGTDNINEAYLKDHLGNIRVVYYMQAGILKTQQVNSYYPFGMNIKGLTADGSTPYPTYKKNKYLYNGKMMQDEMGLGWLDYGARFYDPVLGRWHSVDPRAEEDRDFSPYVYVADNPMSNVDPDGEFLFTVIGAVVGGAVAAVKGGSWKEIGKSALAGAVAGAVIDITIATGGTAGALIAAGAVSGMAGEATHQALDGNFNLKNLAVAGAVGLAFGMAAEAAPGIARTISGALRKGTVEPGELSIVKFGDDAANTTETAAGSGTPRIKTTQQLRNEWEEANGTTWPKDPKTGKNMVADHEIPLADGGADHGTNITPRTNSDHIQRHNANGDFKRWGSRRKKN